MVAACISHPTLAQRSSIAMGAGRLALASPIGTYSPGRCRTRKAAWFALCTYFLSDIAVMEDLRRNVLEERPEEECRFIAFVTQTGAQMRNGCHLAAIADMENRLQLSGILMQPIRIFGTHAACKSTKWMLKASCNVSMKYLLAYECDFWENRTHAWGLFDSNLWSFVLLTLLAARKQVARRGT